MWRPWPKALVHSEPSVTKALEGTNFRSSLMHNTHICVDILYRILWTNNIQPWASRYTVYTYKLVRHVCRRIVALHARWTLKTCAIFKIYILKFCRPLSQINKSDLKFKCWNLHMQSLSDSPYPAIHLGTTFLFVILMERLRQSKSKLAALSDVLELKKKFRMCETIGLISYRKRFIYANTNFTSVSGVAFSFIWSTIKC